MSTPRHPTPTCTVLRRPDGRRQMQVVDGRGPGAGGGGAPHRGASSRSSPACRWPARVGLHGLFDDVVVPRRLPAIGAIGAGARVRRPPAASGSSLGEAIAASVVVFVIVGMVVVGRADAPRARLLRRADEVVGRPAVRHPPADLHPELRVVPFALAWFGTMLGGELLRCVPPARRADPRAAASLVASPCCSAPRTAASRSSRARWSRRAPWRSAVAAGRPRSAASGQDTRSAPRRIDGDRRGACRLAPRGGVLALVAVAAPLLGPQLPLAEAHERYDLRDRSTHRGIRWRCRARSSS